MEWQYLKHFHTKYYLFLKRKFPFLWCLLNSIIRPQIALKIFNNYLIHPIPVSCHLIVQFQQIFHLKWWIILLLKMIIIQSVTVCKWSKEKGKNISSIWVYFKEFKKKIFILKVIAFNLRTICRRCFWSERDLLLINAQDIYIITIYRTMRYK